MVYAYLYDASIISSYLPWTCVSHAPPEPTLYRQLVNRQLPSRTAFRVGGLLEYTLPLGGPSLHSNAATSAHVR